MKKLLLVLAVLALSAGVVDAQALGRNAVVFGAGSSSWASAVTGDIHALQGLWNTTSNLFLHTQQGGGAGIDWQLDQITYSVKAFGAKGDGTDDTTAINNAITAASNGRVFFPSATYKVTGSINANVAGVTLDLGQSTINSTASAVIVVSASNVTIEGDANKGTLNLNLAAGNQFGIQPSGTVSNLTVKGITVNGTGLVADNQTGYGNLSGPVMQNIVIERNVFQNLVVGIDFNADSAGSLTSFVCRDNYVYNIVGTGSGQGYGIHHANGSGNASLGLIEGNTIDSAMRHDIYEAKGSGIAIIGNKSIRHRTGLSLGQERPSIVISRSNNITVADNVIEAPVGGCMSIDTDVILTTGYGITVTGNTCRNWFDWGAITLGTSTPSTDGVPTDVLLENNVLYNNVSVSGATGGAVQAIHVNAGKRISFVGNSININNAPSASNAIEIIGTSETSGTANYTDYLSFKDNLINFSGTSVHGVYEFDSTMCASGIRAEFLNNTLVGGSATFFPDATVTDANLYVLNQPSDGITTSLFHTVATGGPLTVSGVLTCSSTTSVPTGSAGAIDTSSSGIWNVGNGNMTGVQLHSAVKYLDFESASANPPSFNARSAGERITLLDVPVGASTANYAMGIEGSAIWLGLPTTGAHGVKVYGGTTFSAQIAAAGGFYSNPVSTIASGSTVAPVNRTTHITGTTTINTITAPAECSVSGYTCKITFVFDGVAPWSATGNIFVAGTPTTAGTFVDFVFDQATLKWYPSRTS